jgi:HK97 family phage major capsid protein
MNAAELQRKRLNDEANAALIEAERLSLTMDGKNDKATRTRIDVLLAKASGLRTQAAAVRSDEERLEQFNERAGSLGLPVISRFGDAEKQHSHREQRDALFAYLKHGQFRSGLTTATGSGGALIPADFQRELFKGIAQYSDLMNEANVTLIRDENNRPLSVPGFDLSSISCSIIAQNAQQTAGNTPTVTRNTLGGYTYKTTPIAATLEIEQDSFDSIYSILNQAFAVGIARGVGADLVNGNGSTAPEGLLTAAANSNVTTGAAGVISAADISAIYFSLNRAYRNSTKCAWVVSDTTYELLRNAKDSSNRPLLNMSEDGEKLMGKRVLIAPDVPSGAGSKGIVFGDLSQYAVRVNSISVRRSFELPGYAETGTALYTAMLRVDANLIAPGSVQPVVYATLHS